MTLSELVTELPGGSSLIITPESRLTCKDILAMSSCNENSVVGSTVAICLNDPVVAITCLVALDGLARKIVILPPTLTHTAAISLIKQSSCDYIVTHNDELFTDTETPVFHSITAISADGKSREKPKSTQWIIATSGTTSEPKLVGHTLSSLCRTTNTNSSRGAEQRWGLLYDHSRFAGIQVILQSILSGATLLIPDQTEHFEESIDFLIKQGCSHLSGTPTLWRKIVMVTNCEELPLQQITMGGEIVDQGILTKVKSLYPNARIVHIFASTEAGVAFSVVDGFAGFPVDYLKSLPHDVEIRVVDNALFVRNNTVATKYIGSEDSISDSSGWVNTGDLVELRDDRYCFLGRSNGVINVGGNKVHPEKVEHILLEKPNVVAARIYAKKNSITGTVVVAEVVLKEEHPDTLKALKSHASSKLQRYEVPVLIKSVPSIEINATGKLNRKRT